MMLLFIYTELFLMSIIGLLLFGTIRNLRKVRAEKELIMLIKGGKRRQ